MCLPMHVERATRSGIEKLFEARRYAALCGECWRAWVRYLPDSRHAPDWLVRPFGATSRRERASQASAPYRFEIAQK